MKVDGIKDARVTPHQIPYWALMFVQQVVFDEIQATMRNSEIVCCRRARAFLLCTIYTDYLLLLRFLSPFLSLTFSTIPSSFALFGLLCRFHNVWIMVSIYYLRIPHFTITRFPEAWSSQVSSVFIEMMWMNVSRLSNPASFSGTRISLNRQHIPFHFSIFL